MMPGSRTTLTRTGTILGCPLRLSASMVRLRSNETLDEDLFGRWPTGRGPCGPCSSEGSALARSGCTAWPFCFCSAEGRPHHALMSCGAKVRCQRFTSSLQVVSGWYSQRRGSILRNTACLGTRLLLRPFTRGACVSASRTSSAAAGARSISSTHWATVTLPRSTLRHTWWTSSTSVPARIRTAAAAGETCATRNTSSIVLSHNMCSFTAGNRPCSMATISGVSLWWSSSHTRLGSLPSSACATAGEPC
mmetsp:Transcript_102925/g.287201  ORF Transcript_102925/g.287201 Transcript_102925/m.287201 type:complete len:249 (+) Transcript_102925:1629-2375(+)